MARGWTQPEIKSVVDWYFEHLKRQERSQRAGSVRALPSPPPTIEKRRASSVTEKCHHISKMLKDKGCPWLQGYEPLQPKAVQAELWRYVIQRAIAERYLQVRDAEKPTANPQELDRRVELLLARAGDTFPPPAAREEPAPRVGQSGLIFKRNPSVKAWVLWNAKGCCELCGKQGPFLQPTGEPYLEVHHVRPLAEGGPDNIRNTVALCPNCHRRLHHGLDAHVQRDHLFKGQSKIARLHPYPRQD